MDLSQYPDSKKVEYVVTYIGSDIKSGVQHVSAQSVNKVCTRHGRRLVTSLQQLFNVFWADLLQRRFLKVYLIGTITNEGFQKILKKQTLAMKVFKDLLSVQLSTISCRYMPQPFMQCNVFLILHSSPVQYSATSDVRHDI